jgi:hypothetical protein
MERERGGSRSQRTRGGGHFALRVLREPRALFWGRATHPTLPTGRPHVKCWRRAAATHGKADRRTAARPSAPGAASRRLRTSSPAGVPTQALGADSSDRRRTCDRDVSGDSPKETVAARRVDNDHGRRSEGDRRLTASHWSTWEMKRASGSGAPSNLPSPDPPYSEWRNLSDGRNDLVARLPHSAAIGIGVGLAASPSHTTGHTGPYPAVRRIKRTPVPAGGAVAGV